jgi:hypothetical protein
MTTLGVTIAAAAVLAGAGLILRSWLKLRGTRLVTCPENHQPVAVDLDVAHAVTTGAAGFRELRLRDCSRWPEKQGCGQICLSEIEASPEACLVRHVLADWYRDKSCAYCGRQLGPIHWHDHKPALKAADDRVWEWHEVPPERLPAMLATSRPVCWSCMIAEGFRRDHRDLVIDRPPRPRPSHSHPRP